MDLWVRQLDGRWHWQITDADGIVLESSRPNGFQQRDQAVRDGQKRFPLHRDNSDWERITTT